MSTAAKSNRRSKAHKTSAEVLLRVSNTIATLGSLDEQLETLAEVTTELLDCDRSSIFLHDDVTGELYARVAQGLRHRSIRVLDSVGLAGAVYNSGQSLAVPDAYADSRFNPDIDERTGYRTQSVLCSPIRTRQGTVLGVAQALNHCDGPFTAQDVATLESIMEQAATVLQTSLSMSKMRTNQRKEAEFLSIVADISSEIQLGPLLQMIMRMVTRMLEAERSTLFLNDPKSNELYTEIGEGIETSKIRFPNDKGIAGTVFQTKKSIHIPYAYADLRFNPAFDKKTGFFTRSLLCVPVINKHGQVIGVTQVLNKIGGNFTEDDEVRLKAFTAQIAIALENAKLFDEVQRIKNYNESILESMSNGVITCGADRRITTCNKAGLRILAVAPEQIIGRRAEEFFTGNNAWLVESIERVVHGNTPVLTLDREMDCSDGKKSVNVNVLPLTSHKGEHLGSLTLIEDISSEKRMKTTMSRYMDPGLADKLLSAGDNLLGGQTSEATVLFSDIRSFTTLTEELGAQGTVALLNEYFSIMVDCIQAEGGMLDKYIGDAIMAVFGTPFAHDDDPDRAVRASIAMMRELATFNRNRAAHGKKPVDIGIGLNSDLVVSGNIGSQKRMDYTVIGDGVNLASRLESACKQYGAHLLISEFTFQKLRATYRTREVDSVVVKGKTEPVRIHEVLDYHTEATFPRMSDVLKCFRDGLAEYRRGQWDRAIAAFRDGLEIHPGDKAALLYVERCEELKAHPPEGTWNGVWVMDHK